MLTFVIHAPQIIHDPVRVDGHEKEAKLIILVAKLVVFNEAVDT